MTIPQGTHVLTEANGDLLLYTTVEGPAAALGHNLILRADHWRATLTVGEAINDTDLAVEVQLDSLHTVGSRGGARPVAAGDIKTIDANIGRALGTASHPVLTFQTERVEGSFDKAELTGRMALRGRTEEQTFTVEPGEEEGQVVLRGVVTQTRYGVKPFSTMIGAMRLGDDVTVKVTAKL